MKPPFVSLPPPAASQERIKFSFAIIINSHKQLLKDRYLDAYMSREKMILKYKTRGGFFTRCSFNDEGLCIMKEYFKSYDSETGKLFDYLFTRRMPSIFE